MEVVATTNLPPPPAAGDAMDVDDTAKATAASAVAPAPASASAPPASADVDPEEKRRMETLADMERIEKEFQDIKEKFYREKIEQIRKEMEAINQGNHEKLIAKLREAELKKEEKIWAAEQWRQYQLMSIDNMFSGDKQQAEDELDEEKQFIREKMLQALQDRQKKLEEDKNTMSLQDGADIRAQALPSRNLRSTKKGKENTTVVNHRAKKLTPAHINYVLRENEINEDLTAIQKALFSRDRLKMSDIFFDRGQLRYYDKVFEKGQTLMLETAADAAAAGGAREPAQTGVVVLISPQEVQLRLPDSSKARVTLAQLRLGRYTLHLPA